MSTVLIKHSYNDIGYSCQFSVSFYKNADIVWHFSTLFLGIVYDNVFLF